MKKTTELRHRILVPAMLALSLLAWAGTASAAPPARDKPPLDINSASRQQLKKLPGIGDAEAGRIIAGRPYLSKADLVSTKAIPAGTYLQIKRSIIAKPPKKPGGKAQQ